jgi:hypothetical protein
VLPDVPVLEQQLLGLVWKGGKITHPAGQHDDFCTSAAGVVSLLATPGTRFAPIVFSYAATSAEKAAAFWDSKDSLKSPSRSQAEDDRIHLIRCGDPRSCDHHPAHARAPAAARPMTPSRAVDDARGIYRVSTPSGGRETYVDLRGLEEPPEAMRGACLLCPRQPSQLLPGPAHVDIWFADHWLRRHPGTPMPQEGQRWKVYVG